jgi:rod shape-determining protein MreD
MPFISAISTVILAIFLSIFPFSQSVIGYMPPWMLVLCLLFMYRKPLVFGIVWAFLCGFLSDLLEQSYIGFNGLLFIITGILFRLLLGYFISLSELGKVFLALMLILFYQVLKIVLLFWLHDYTIYDIQYTETLISSVIGVVLLSLLHNFYPKDEG